MTPSEWFQVKWFAMPSPIFFNCVQERCKRLFQILPLNFALI